MAKYVYERYTTTFSYDDPFFNWVRSGYVYRPSPGEFRVKDTQRPIRTSSDVSTFTASALQVGNIVTWTASSTALTNWINGASNMSFVRIRFKDSADAYGVERTQYMSYTEYISVVKKGSLVATVIAEEGTYPDDGIDGDYWYIKTRKAFPDIHVKVNGELRKVQSAWVKVGGHTTPVLPERQKEYIAYANSPDGIQDFSLTPNRHAYVGLYQGLDIDSLGGEGENLIKKHGQDRQLTTNGITIVKNGVEYHIFGKNTEKTKAYGLGINWLNGNIVFLEPGQTYTLSTNIPLPSGTYLGWNGENAAGTQVALSYLQGNGVRRSTTFKVPDDYQPTTNGFFGIYKEADELDYTVKIKLEKGSTATPWTPAPADILAAINNPNSYTWMSKSMYHGVLKEIKDIYIKKDGQLKKGV